MALTLSDEDRALLAGDEGAGPQMAMRILRRMAEIQGAPRFIPIESAHIDGCLYEGDAIVEFVERLAGLGARVRVPTTLNAVSVEVGHWREQGVPEHFGQQAMRIVRGYLAMGAQATFSCSPYQIGHRPGFGRHVAWAESNAIAFANTVLGARTDRYGDFLDVCAAIAGRVPEAGLHVEAKRRGQVRFRLDDDISDEMRRRESFYPLLGYLVGDRSAGRIPVVEGLPSGAVGGVGEDQLKAFLAAAASSGSVALAHLVGVTPEAPDAATAFQGEPPEEEIVFTLADFRQAYGELGGPDAAGALDAVVLGSPHFSLEEFRAFAAACQGMRVAPGVRMLITTSSAVRQLAERAGWLQAAQAFGAEIVVDTCILLSPLLHADVKTMMTNSGKYAHYSPGKLGLQVVFGSLRDCVRSAAAGRAVVEDEVWV